MLTSNDLAFHHPPRLLPPHYQQVELWFMLATSTQYIVAFQLFEECSCHGQPVFFIKLSTRTTPCSPSESPDRLFFRLCCAHMSIKTSSYARYHMRYHQSHYSLQLFPEVHFVCIRPSCFRLTYIYNAYELLFHHNPCNNDPPLPSLHSHHVLTDSR